MDYLTPDQIAALCEDITDPRANRRAINKLYREQDDSHLWPICGEFCAVDRAVRHLRPLVDQDPALCGLEYSLAMHDELSRIVNSAY